ncbi:hypothetical protein QTG56_16950 [Rossellomorea sp. AcN35-11]|nr:hypothetical protein QTG56_16950 [Rossellomorea sp. AcN35-11]
MTFIVSFAIELSEKWNGLKFLTPFKYFEAKSLLAGEGLDMLYVTISIVLITILGFMTFLFYNKRDLNV